MCGDQLLNVTFSFLSAGCIRWTGFVPIRVSCRRHRRRVGGLSMLYKVNWNSNHCLFSELPSASTKYNIPELQSQLTHWSLKYQGVQRPNLLSLRWLRFDCGTGTLDGFKGTVSHWLLPWVVFSSISVEQMLVGLQKQLIHNFVFPHLGLLLVLIIII